MEHILQLQILDVPEETHGSVALQRSGLSILLCSDSGLSLVTCN
ncbi:MAG: SapB/AmfS family lanthipeptide [Pseudonocardia sp.]